MTYNDAMLRSAALVEDIKNSTDKSVYHKDVAAVTDIRDMMRRSVMRYPDRPAFLQRFVKGEPFRAISYKSAWADINALGTQLIAMGLKDKRIAVIGKNCYQWALSYLSVVCGVGVIVPLDKELPGEELAGLCKSAEVSAVMFAGSKYLPMFKQIQAENGRIEVLVNLEENETKDGVYGLKELVTNGRALIDAGDRSYQDAEIDPDVMSILLFTSGTTGIAKGVMLSQWNLMYDLIIAHTNLLVLPDDVFLSILPVHHTYECTCGFLAPLYRGACIAYCEGLKYIQKNLKEIKPTKLLVVPLILESLYKSIWKNVAKQGKTEQVRKVMAVCGKLGKPGLALQKKLLKDIYDVFGGNLRHIICGGAAVDPAILDFFCALGFSAVQGYGLTECSPMVALNPDHGGMARSDSVGHAFIAQQARIDKPDAEGVGEICIKGDNIMLGYYNMPEETANAIQDGWFHTGDLGYIDKDGFIYITGRRKNVIIAGNGKNVFPEELEHYLGRIPYVAESMVWADKDESGRDTVIVASIYPDKDAVAAASGGEYSKEAAQKLLEQAVDEINDGLPLFKQMRRVLVRENEFEKTTGKKIKRFAESNKQA